MKLHHQPKRFDARRERASVLIIVLWVCIGLVSIALYFANQMTYELRAADKDLPASTTARHSCPAAAASCAAACASYAASIAAVGYRCRCRAGRLLVCLVRRRRVRRCLHHAVREARGPRRSACNPHRNVSAPRRIFRTRAGSSATRAGSSAPRRIVCAMRRVRNVARRARAPLRPAGGSASGVPPVAAKESAFTAEPRGPRRTAPPPPPRGNEFAQL